MKKVILVLLISVNQIAHAQGKIKVGLRIMPSVNAATVNDKDGTPSAVNFAADGSTTKESNLSGLGLGLFLDYALSEKIAFSTGLGISPKNFEIRNTDGNYSGVSRYHSNYLQIPFLLKFSGIKLSDKLNMYINVGPTFNVLANESLDGSDYAHYWNMSHNLTYNDPTRGKNSNGKSMNLFNSLDLTVYASTGITLNLMENVDFFGGIFFDYGLMNVVNSELRFAEPNQTKVSTDIAWKSFLIGLELGVTYQMK
ncbi:MAG: outer membrane beta-barrel protein [Bacteroidetes bacterium]|nr:outer membrane beta-barrel protein [Bacteroidota bacterium]